MALNVITGGHTNFVGSVRMEGDWSGAEDPVTLSFQWGIGSFGNNTNVLVSSLESGSYTRTPNVDKDRTIKFRAKAQDINGVDFGDSSGEFKTFADPAVFGSGLVPGTPTTTTCPVSGGVTPNTVESTGDVYIEYRVQGTGTWSAVPSPIASGISGAASVPLSATLSGLVPGTTYEARFLIERNTENAQSIYSSVGTFTTASTSQTIISPQLMLATAQMFAPSSVGPDLTVNISPAVMEAQAEMLTPAVYVSQQAVINIYVQFNDVILREIIFE